MSSQPVIQTVHLYKRFGDITALDDVNITVARGEFVAIMGSSGSGKTTLMNILTCLDTPSKGQVLLNGTDAAALDEEARRTFRARTIGLVFQQFHLLPYLTACENVMLAQYYHSVTDKAAALTALERVGLGHRSSHLPKQLSGGEQQRVCIARALINEPEILFADEPTGNLDAENERIVLNIFAELHAQGRTIVMVTHNPDLGQQTDRIIQLQHGKIIE
jgi:macrolide-specific ABC efflux carrier macB